MNAASSSYLIDSSAAPLCFHLEVKISASLTQYNGGLVWYCFLQHVFNPCQELRNIRRVLIKLPKQNTKGVPDLKGHQVNNNFQFCSNLERRVRGRNDATGLWK